jgi:molybdate transport system ATP-binding protein
LRRVLENQTAILVTHDVLDAWTLADRVAVMSDGHIVEIGSTREVFERPRSQFTAALVGLNLVTGLRTALGLATDAGVALHAADTAIPVGSRVGATVRPAVVQISVTKPTGSELNVLEGRVVDLEPRGDVVRVSTELLFADVPPATVAKLDLVPGASVWSSFAASDVTLFAL